MVVLLAIIAGVLLFGRAAVLDALVDCGWLLALLLAIAAVVGFVRVIIFVVTTACDHAQREAQLAAVSMWRSDLTVGAILLAIVLASLGAGWLFS